MFANKMIRKRVVVLTLLFCWPFACLLQAQEEQGTTGQTVESDVPAESNKQSESSAENTGKSNQQGDYQVFKPSEEISEDLSVPFPTDI